MRNLPKTVAWITGGSGGIGAAISYALAKEGANVAISYYSNRDQADEIARNCAEIYHVQARSIFTDVKERSSVHKAYDEIVDLLGYPSILIHAAGMTQSCLFQDYTDYDINEMIDIHIKGAFYVIQRSLDFLLKQKNGRIICISSIWGDVGGAYEVLYSTVKGAQHALVKSLAKELAPSGITVNAVAPGAIRTNMITKPLTIEDQEFLIDQIPIGRLGEPHEVASLVNYLCQKEASYLTGQVIYITGGWHG